MIAIKAPIDYKVLQGVPNQLMRSIDYGVISSLAAHK